MKMIYQRVLPVILLFFMGAISACKKEKNDPATLGPGVNEVWIQNSKFNPATIILTVNTTVMRWVNKDGMAHAVTGTSFDSGPSVGGNAYPYQFTTWELIPIHVPCIQDNPER